MCIGAYIYMYMYIHLFFYVTYIYIYIHTYIHTYKYIYTYRSFCLILSLLTCTITITTQPPFGVPIYRLRSIYMDTIPVYSKVSNPQTNREAASFDKRKMGQVPI